ncbi:glycoside hydrolase family 13 protein [Zobellella taiwanensis]
MTTTTSGRLQRSWWKEAVAYQIYPRSFMDANGDGIGDLNGIIIKLDYLKELGVDVIWLCPMYKSPNDDNGYDISDYQDIMDEFGTLADFDRLLAEVHDRGMRLIIDLVVNHTSDEHPWFIESRSSKDNPKRDWYVWRDGKNGAEPNNWESIFKGSAWEYDQGSGQYYLHLFSRKQPDLNWENPEVRGAIYDMMRWWLDKGIDGFRLDAISHIKKEAGLSDAPNPEALPYAPAWDKMMNVEGIIEHLDELCRETFNRYDIMTVGEANGVSPAQAEDWIGKRHQRLDMIFAFDHVGLWAEDEAAGLDLSQLKQAFGLWQTGVEGFGWNALFVENHDIPRIVSKWGDSRDYWRESATAIAAMYFLMQGTPFIYQGQEIGMTNTVFDGIDDFNDVAAKNQYAELQRQGWAESDILAQLSRTGRDNSRTPMQWEAGPRAGFTSGQPWLKVNPNVEAVNVAAQQGDPDSVLGFYRALIRLRKDSPALIYGRYQLLLAEHPQVYAYSRTLGEDRWLVLVNLSGEPAAFGALEAPVRGLTPQLANYPPATETEETLRPFEARVYRLD